MAERELNFSNQKEYLNYINKFPRIGRPVVGCVMTFTYMFHLAEDFKDKDLKDKKFYSFQPMDLCIANRPSKNLFTCINLNQIPVKARQYLLNILKKIYPSQFDEGRILIRGVNYKKLIRWLRKSKIAIRSYRYERVKVLRYVPAENIDEWIHFTSNFYYRTNYNWVANRYRSYNPDK